MGLLPAIARGVIELAKARLRHRIFHAHEINLLNAQSVKRGRAAGKASARDARLIEEIQYVLPRLAKRMPWRADCLVQAMAAQHWLESEGIATTIAIGVHKSDSTDFEAHAWLSYGDIVVTGGENSHYTVMIQHEMNP